ncbi:MAG: carbohydrate kinase family protein [Bacilli bacterium]|nr:carbohydrate kinase family protein [Bacilli bacterium]
MKIALSGLLNLEVTTRTRGFPIPYYPIDYPFFGVNLYPGGVGYNLAKALKTLGDEVDLYSLIGDDDAGKLIREELERIGISSSQILPILPQTPMSSVLYDEAGKRQIYCDLKDIQDRSYTFEETQIAKADFVIATNINFSRGLLPIARKLGKTIATDVHVLRDPDDAYNRDFMMAADILFLSDEGIEGNPENFIRELEERYHNRIIVLGRGAEGSFMYERVSDSFTYQQAYHFGEVKNTVGAGDSFFAAFIHFYALGEKPREALTLASAFAAIKVCADGASNGFVSEEDVRRALAGVRR